MDTHTTNAQELQNENVRVTVHHEPHCVVRLKVRAEPHLVKAAHSKAIKSLSKEVTLPGFRKGKAPEALVLKHFAHGIDDKWQKHIAEDSFKESENLAKIPVLNNDSKIRLSMQSHSLENGAELEFAFETEPTIPTIQAADITLPKIEKPVVDDAKLDEILHRIRLFFCKWTAIDSRPVQKGDFIIVDVDLLEDGGTTQRVFSDARLEVAEKNMAQWMFDLVIGMNVGESKEGLSEVDANASEEDKQQFTPKKVLINIKTIEEPVLPPVDDALAQKVGAESADIMKERLMNLLHKDAKDSMYAQLREELSKFFLENYPFEVPMSLLEKEVEFRFSQKIKNRKFKAEYERLSKDEKKAEIDKLKKESEDALRLFYICRQIIQDQKIQLSEAELNPKINSPLDAMFADQELLNPPKNEEEKAVLVSKYMLKKAEDFLISQILDK